MRVVRYKSSAFTGLSNAQNSGGPSSRLNQKEFAGNVGELRFEVNSSLLQFTLYNQLYSNFRVFRYCLARTYKQFTSCLLT